MPPDLFNEDKISTRLKNFDPQTSDYYKAVLQNLFFATLNMPIGERKFSGADPSTYRYAELLQNSQGFLEHLKQVPFVNGGLFDCLDKPEQSIDGFTAEANDNLKVPTKLFFDNEDGIFTLFNRYKFTVKENTPVEIEVALDPELLGQVFENLLGAYNPETRKAATKRKNTGSYYTPRGVVGYMVDEALISYFLQTVKPYDNDKAYLEERLRFNIEDLLDYESQGEADTTVDHLIHEDEIDSLIEAINELKIIDPAVGSGAFPMDILNKLVQILQKLDPRNERWKQTQLTHASQFSDPVSKQNAINEIEEVFSKANDHNDYGRKLYLIQNCLYGVDIQPFAITIAKLRFFISLIIEQTTNTDWKNNYGIRPLPNLETKLVAANTLIGLKSLDQPELQLDLFGDDTIKSLLSQIQVLHYNYVGVNTPESKSEHIATQEALRTELSAALTEFYETWCTQQQNRIRDKLEGFEGNARKKLNDKLQREYIKNEEKLKMYVAEAQRIADWNPYDPNAAADFFEPKYMFGVDRFDIAIGNPPYIRHEKIKHLKPALQEQFNDFFTSTADISTYFYKRAASILRDKGILVYICTNKFLRSDYGENLRNFLSAEMTILKLLDLGNVPVFKAAVDTCITPFLRCSPPDEHSFPAVTLRKADEQFNLRDAFQSQSFPIALADLESDVWAIAPPDAQALLKKIKNTGVTLGRCVDNKIYFGIKTGCNDAFVIDADTRDKLIDEDAQSEELIKPLFRGKNLRKWKLKLEIETKTEFLITIASSTNREWVWSDTDPDEAEIIFESEYPAVCQHLNQFRESLIKRQDKGKYYWELRSCTYYSEFDKPKIVYPDISKSMRAYYDTTGTFGEATTFCIPSTDLSLLAILNSQLFDWYARYKFQTLKDPWADGSLRFKTIYMEQIPIADRTPEQQAELSELVEQILDDPLSKNVPDIEKEINDFVYRLYGLLKKEINLIKQTYKDAGMT